MAEQLDPIVAHLNRLIETCMDGAEGYRTAAGRVKNSELRTLFESYSQQRHQFVADLQDEVRRRGGQAEDAGSLAGTLHRGWIGLKSLVSGKDDGSVIGECERGEEVAKHAYEEVLKENWPPELTNLLQKHFAAVQEACERIRALELVASNRS